MVRRLKLVGSDSCDYGNWTELSTDKVTALLSVGADDRSPSLKYKGTLNEDALCFASNGDYEVYCIADAHFGDESSQYLVTMLHDQFENWTFSDVSQAGDEFLDQFFAALIQLPNSGQSESAVCICLLHVPSRFVFCMNIGDASVIKLSADDSDTATIPTLLNFQNHVYTCTGSESKYRHSYWLKSSFELKANESIVMFTDGVDECCYRKPERSIQFDDIAEIWQQSSSPRNFANDLMRTALTGIRGNPGGQDNIAILIRY